MCGKALCVDSASLYATGNNANTTIAELCVRTIVVRSATGIALFNRHTSSTRVHNHVVGTAAHHRANWQRINDSASLVRQAHIRFGARVLASSIEASQLTRAVLIGATLRLRWPSEFLTSHVRITCCSRTTLTNGLMVLSSTRGRVCAGFFIAHLAANSVQAVTRLVVGAVLVILTLSSYTGHQGIALVSWLADTIGSMILRKALGSLSAMQWAVMAWIQALFVVTSLVVGTIGIVLAFSCEFIRTSCSDKE